jgi:hypothetical protein
MPPIEPTATAMAHPSSMFAIPADQDLAAGLVGTVERAMPEGPSWRVRLRLDERGARTVTCRWEWDLAPPKPGARLAVVVVPGTLRFFTSSGHAVDRHPRAAARRGGPAGEEPVAAEPVAEEPMADLGSEHAEVEAPEEHDALERNGYANGAVNGAATGFGRDETTELEPRAGEQIQFRSRERPPVE